MQHTFRSAALVAMGALIFSTVSWTPVAPAPDAQAAGITQPVRVRMDLDTRNMYLYADSATATTRLKDAAVSGVNVNTWLDLSNAANNKAASKTSYCLAVNNNGYTVYVNQDGPVASCANQTPISRVMVGEARTLTAPTGTASASSSAPTIGTSVTGSISGAANVARQEWILPDGTSATASTTSALTYNTTASRTLTLRTVGTKGERVSTTTINPQSFTVTVTAKGTPGATGGTSWVQMYSQACYYSGSVPYGSPVGGSGGSSGGRAQGSYTVTSLPVTFTATIGSSTNAGSTGGYADLVSLNTCPHRNWGGTGGTSGRSSSVTVGGTTIAQAGGGAGGTGGRAQSYNPYSCCYPIYGNGGAGGAAMGSNSTSGLLSPATGWDSTDSSPSITVRLPGGAQVSRTTNGTITVSSLTSIS